MPKPRLETLKAQSQLLQEEIASKQKKLAQLTKKIETITEPKEITISDHALVRYLEREMELDLSKLKQIILTDEIIKQTKILGGKGKFTADNLTYVIDNYTVVTIY